MKKVDFVAILKAKNIEYHIGENSIIITGDEYVDLAELKSIPNNVTFSNFGAVYLDSLIVMPETTVFANGFFVYVPSLHQFPSSMFIHRGNFPVLDKKLSVEGVLIS